MDTHTLELLEFGKVRDLLAGYAACSLGKDLARQIEPGTDTVKIRNELALVSEMTDLLASGEHPPLGGLHDVRLLVRRAAIGSMLNAEQLLQVAETLNCTGNIYRYKMRLKARFTGISQLLAPVEDLGLVAKSISGCIDSRGLVLDMASRELAVVRQKLAELEERVQNQIRRLLRDPELRKILRYPNATVSGDHFVLPVAVNHRHKLQGIVHRTSPTGETVYIEPAGIANLSAEQSVLKSEEDREIQKILRRLTAEIGRVSRPLSFAIDIIGRLDFITAKARFSLAFNMSAPDIADDGQLWLRQARHPLLEHLFRHEHAAISKPGEPTAPPREQRQVVPIDVRLGQPFHMLVITGPNTGGKTVTLKTVGLLCAMAQAGLHIPAGQGSAVPAFDQILADIGDEQSIEQSLSTFSAHISRIAAILKTATERSLVMLDELGAGTDPTEGAALGRAILDELDELGCRAMVTTHLGDLKTYAFTNEHAENAAVEFDLETLRPTYRLHIGQFGMSNALKIAKRLKLSRELLRRAHKYLRRRQRRAPELVRLQQLREEAEKARASALAAQHNANQEQEEYRQKVEELRRDAERLAALREMRSRLAPDDRVHVQRFDKVGRVIRVDHKKGIAVISLGLGQWEVPLEEVFPPEEKSPVSER
jgi:DNA mismatch repair protein MutS2